MKGADTLKYIFQWELEHGDTGFVWEYLSSKEINKSITMHGIFEEDYEQFLITNKG